MSIVMSLSLTFIEECHGFHVNSHVIITDLYWRVSWISCQYLCHCHWSFGNNIMDFIPWYSCQWHQYLGRVSWILWQYSCQCHWPLLKSVMDFMSIVMSLSLTFIEECHGFHVNSHVIVTDLYWRVSLISCQKSCHCHWPLLKSVIDSMSIVMSMSLTFIEECHGFNVNSHVIVTDLYWRKSWISCQ